MYRPLLVRAPFSASGAVFVLTMTALLVMAGVAHAQFGTIINIPPDPNIPDHGGIGSGTQLNLKGGGTIGISFEAGSQDNTSTNVEVNVQGGSVGSEYHANGGSVTNVTGGFVGNLLDANLGSIVNIAGGSVGSGLDANSGSTVNISGGTVGSAMEAFDADVNISGGSVGNDFHILSDSLVDISGGRVGFFMHAATVDQLSSNVEVNVSGGVLDGGIEVYNGAQITFTGGLILGSSSYGINFNILALGYIYGGIVDYDFNTFIDSDVKLFGSDFELDDMPLAASGQKINIPSGSILSGILADGTPIMLSDTLGDNIANQTLSLHSAALPPPGPTSFTVPTDTPPPSIRDGQTLTLNNGGLVGEQFRAGRGSTVNVTGGQLGLDFEAFGATINISGGSVFSDFAAMEDSMVNISGGSVGAFFDAGRGTVVNISGGSLGIGARALSESEVNISGGSLGSFFNASSGSEVNISGGAISNSFGAFGTLNLFGGEFRLDGALVGGLGTIGDSVPLNIPAGSVLSGTLADGTPFAFSSQTSDGFSDGTLTLHAAALPPVGPSLINVPASPVPLGIRQGQTLNLSASGVVGGIGVFSAGLSSTVVVTGGEFNATLRAIGATANISGGRVQGINSLEGSEINISGTATASNVSAYANSTVNVQGGTLSGIKSFSGSTVNITGGIFTGSLSQRAFEASFGSEVNVSGGQFNGRFGAFGAVANISGGTYGTLEAGGLDTVVNLFGSEFLLGGVPIAGLVLDETITVTDRNVTLSGILANGSPFSFDLNTAPVFGADFFTSDVLLTVTLVTPQLLAGDYNANGVVDAADYTVWRDNLGATAGTLPNDVDGGAIGAAQYATWKANFGLTAGSGALTFAVVPEPGTMVLLILATTGWMFSARLSRASAEKP